MKIDFDVLELPQRSPEWYAARSGVLTSSCADDMLTMPKAKGAGESVTRRNLRMRLACEVLTGRTQEDSYVSREMQRGIDIEPTAIGEFEILTGKVARKVGFLKVRTLPVGDSPDAIIGDFEEVVEIKCPNSVTHLKYLKEGLIPGDYFDQCRHHMWVTGAQWLNFISFDDRFPPELQMFHLRAHRDTLYIPEYEKAALKFLGEITAEVDGLRKMVVERYSAKE